MPSQSEIQENITARIVEGLQNGIVPWKKPWKNDPNCGSPANIVSRRNYTGINPILLDLASQAHGFSSRFWATYDQWQKLGGQVRKRPDNVKPGHWGTNIVFFRQVKTTKVDAAGEEKVESFPLMKFYTVFNLDQVAGEKLDHLRPSTETTAQFPDFTEAEKVIAATGAEIKLGGNRAVYTRPVGNFPNHSGGDFIRVPERVQFDSQHEFYATCFHELVHWSEVRLGWEGSYALGELIAEMGACFLCAQTNIPSSDDLSNHTSYLAAWLKSLQDDRKFIFKAAAQASKASEFILKFSRPKVEVPELQEVEA
jgi:antirestriction protein ArdC